MGTKTSTPHPTPLPPSHISQPSLPKISEMQTINQSYSTDQDIDEFIEKDCCGVHLMTRNKNKSTIEMYNWQDAVLKFCQLNKGKLVWVDQVGEVVRQYRDNTRKYKKDYNDIKYLQKEPTKSERDMSLNAAEVDKFRNNLKRSVLLHYNQVVQGPNGAENSRIQSSIRMEPLGMNNSKKSMNAKSSLLRQSMMSKASNGRLYRKENVKMSFSKTGRAYARQNLRQSVLNLVDDTMSSLFKGQEQQVSKLNAYSLEVFVKFTVMLERHLTDPENKACQIIRSFYNSLYKNYAALQTKHNTSLSCIKNFKSINSIPVTVQNPTKSLSIMQEQPIEPSQQLSCLEIEQLLQSIKTFILLLTQIVEDYYNIKQFGNIEEGTNYLINNEENLLTVITAIVFKDQKFYNFVFGVVKLFNKQRDDRANYIFERIHGKPPQYFSINKQYCLNSGTVKKFIDDMSSIESNIQNLVPEDLQSTTEQPYHKCSQSLQKIQKSRTPISKMKSILQCAQKITESIIGFYNANQMQLKKTMIDADQVLSIFCYILSLNRINDIFSHIFIIDYFATEHQKISMTGYYFSVLECAIEENFGEEKLSKYEEETPMRKSVMGFTTISEKVDEESRMTSLNGSARKPGN